MGAGRRLRARPAGRQDGADRARLRADADPRAPADRDRDGRRLARRLEQRPLPAGARAVRPAGLGGLVRHRLQETARAHARVRRDRPHRARAQNGHLRRRRVDAAAAGRRARRDRARPSAQAARQAGPGAAADLPRRDRPEGGRADRRDRRRLAPLPAQPGRSRPAARPAAQGRRRRRPHARRDRHRAGRADRDRRHGRGGARARAPVAGLLPRRDGREGQELLRRPRRLLRPRRRRPPLPGAVPGGRPRGRRRRARRRAARHLDDRGDARHARRARRALRGIGADTLVVVPGGPDKAATVRALAEVVGASAAPAAS